LFKRALVDGGTQTICVSACNKNGSPESFTVVSGNSGIAAVTKVDTIFTVTGVSRGSTLITVTSNSGKSKEIPVIIYDLQVLETEELLITFHKHSNIAGVMRVVDNQWMVRIIIQSLQTDLNHSVH